MRDYYMPETPITDAMAVTNADRIRAMSDEELAKFLADEIPHGDCYGCDFDCNYAENSCQRSFYEWLKLPAEDNDNG